MNGGVTVSTFSRRAARERVYQHLSDSNPQLGPMGVRDNFIVQPSVIRLEQEITARTEYRFDLYEVQGGQSPSERKLNRNDAFFASHIALCLLREDTGTPVPISNTQIIAYPDPTIFSAAGEAVALEAFYNALLTIKTDPVERVTDLDTNLLRYLPQFDQPLAWGPSLSERGYFELAGEIIFDGAQNNVITLSLNSDASIAAAVGVTDVTNYLVLMLFGNLVLQGAKKVGKYMA